MFIFKIAARASLLSRRSLAAATALTPCFALAGIASAPAQDAAAPAATTVAKAEPAQAQRAANDNEIARWLAGLPTENGALQNFTSVPAWTNHAKALTAAWDGSERRRVAKVRAWAPEALGPINSADSPVFYFFSGADFLYPHALFPNAKTYVLCAREPVGSQPDPAHIASGELSGALSGFRKSIDALLGFSFFITKELRKDVVQRNIPGILPVLELLLAREGATVTAVQLVRCNDAGEVNGDIKEKGGSSGVRIQFRTEGKPEQTLYYFYGDISNDGLKTHGGVLKFCETLGKGRSLLKAASYLPHEGAFSRINEWILTNSTAIVQDTSGIPMRGFPKDQWIFKFWGHNAAPIHSFKKHFDSTLAAAIKAAPSQPIPFGFGYQHEPASSLLILAERKKSE